MMMCCIPRLCVNPTHTKSKDLDFKVKNFNADHWKCVQNQVAYIAIHAKFMQNSSLQNILLNTGNAKIAESSTDSTWGTGLHLRDPNAMDQHYWVSKEGGLMCEIYSKLRGELRRKRIAPYAPHLKDVHSCAWPSYDLLLGLSSSSDCILRLCSINCLVALSYAFWI